VTKTTKSLDIDFEATNIEIAAPGGTGRLVCGRGANWTTGVPPDDMVWTSTDFREEVYGDTNSGGFGWVDSRGRAKNGTLWRFVGTLGESCHYSGVSERLGESMDCIIERVSRPQ
jgi:hypothetical protein